MSPLCALCVMMWGKWVFLVSHSLKACVRAIAYLIFFFRADPMQYLTCHQVSILVECGGLILGVFYNDRREKHTLCVLFVFKRAASNWSDG